MVECLAQQSFFLNLFELSVLLVKGQLGLEHSHCRSQVLFILFVGLTDLLQPGQPLTLNLSLMVAQLGC